MIFEIDSTIKNINKNDINQLSALEHLIQSHKNGQHILIIKPMDIVFLIQKISTELSTPSRKCLNHLLNNASTTSSVKKIVTEHVVIYTPTTNDDRVLRDGNIWRAPLNYFSNSAIIASSVLGEDPLDAQIYIELASKLLMQKAATGFHIEARPMNGGGSVTPNSYKKILEKELTPCISITDSDRITPAHQDSPTAKKCYEISKGSIRITNHISLKERELENIIPFKWYESLRGKKSVAGKISTLAMDTDCKLNHFDFKEGISLDWITGKSNSVQKYWHSCMTNLTNQKKSCRFCKSTGINCECSKIDGFGNEILDNFLAHLIKSNSIPSEMKTDLRWQVPAQAVLNFTIAPNYSPL